MHIDAGGAVFVSKIAYNEKNRTPVCCKLETSHMHNQPFDLLYNARLPKTMEAF